LRAEAQYCARCGLLLPPVVAAGRKPVATSAERFFGAGFLLMIWLGVFFALSQALHEVVWFLFPLVVAFGCGKWGLGRSCRGRRW